jgi:hypothetical protein
VVQLVPLSPALGDTISPAGGAVLRQIDLGFASTMTLVENGLIADLPARPLSIDPAATTRGLLLLVAFTLLLVGALRYCNAHGPKLLAQWFVGLGVVIALIGIVQKAVLGDFVPGGMKLYGVWTPIGRMATPFGPFVNKNHYAGWMLMAIPVALGYFLSQAEIGLRHLRPGWRLRFLWLSSPEGGRLQLAAFAVVIMSAALVMTLSRSGIACFGMAMAIAALVVARRQGSIRARLGMVAAIAVLVVAPLLWANMNVTQRFSTSNDESLRLRRGIWSDTLRIIRDFPAVGTGLDTLGAAMRAYQTTHEDQNVREAHNDYLQIAAEGGFLIGLPALAALVLLVVSIRRRFTAGEDDPSTSWIRFGAATGLAAVALQSLVEFSLQMPGNAVFFVVLCAMALHRTPHTAGAPSGVPR